MKQTNQQKRSDVIRLVRSGIRVRIGKTVIDPNQNFFERMKALNEAL